MTKLFVVGYPLDIKNQELIEIFSIHGEIQSMDLRSDKFTGHHKGFGFIEMVDDAGAERAINAINGMVIRGRKITVKIADEERKERFKTVKTNDYPLRADVVGERPTEVFKSKRPRKLKSDTFRAGE